MTLYFFAGGDLPCPNGWYEHNGHCYGFYVTKASWFKAQLNCEDHGGHVVSILDNAEDLFLQALSFCRNEFWLGMVLVQSRDWKNATAWKWWDGINHSFTKLNTDEDRPSAEYENCVYHSQNQTWETDNCRQERPYACKKSGNNGLV